MVRDRARPRSGKSAAPAIDEAERRQRAYAARRRAWAEAVGRPYLRQEDPRPPPGELDVDAAEE